MLFYLKKVREIYDKGWEAVYVATSLDVFSTCTVLFEIDENSNIPIEPTREELDTLIEKGSARYLRPSYQLKNNNNKHG